MPQSVDTTMCHCLSCEGIDAAYERLWSFCTATVLAASDVRASTLRILLARHRRARAPNITVDAGIRVFQKSASVYHMYY